jgi:hypothetical protein
MSVTEPGQRSPCGHFNAVGASYCARCGEVIVQPAAKPARPASAGGSAPGSETPTRGLDVRFADRPLGTTGQIVAEAVRSYLASFGLLAAITAATFPAIRDFEEPVSLPSWHV